MIKFCQKSRRLVFDAVEPDRFGQFQIASRHGVHGNVVTFRFDGQIPDMTEILRLCRMGIFQNGTDSTESRVQTGCTEPVQRGDGKLFHQFLFAVIPVEMPCRYRYDTC